MNDAHTVGFRAASAAIAGAGALLALTPTAMAIPAFARRYGESCGTCHTAPPSLTPFGEAFRRNGYRFPSGEDEERSVDEPVALGHDVHRDLFPDEVWPGIIPGNIPLAVAITPSMSLTRGGGEDEEHHGAEGHHGAGPAVGEHGEGEDEGEDEDEDWSVNFGGSDFALLVAGTLGQHLSFFGELEVEAEGEVELKRPNVVIAPFDEPSLMLRAGVFEPALHAFSVHRSLTGHSLAFTTVGLGDNGWSPEPAQAGLQLEGILLHRIGWTAGVVEGAGNEPNRAKDVYGRLEYKLGGMSLDGVEPTGYDRPWQELSLTIGASFYRGFATLEDPAGTGMHQSDAFWRTSTDLSARLVDLALTVAAFAQHDRRPRFAQPASGNLGGLMVEASYVVFPWLIPVVRYQAFRQELPGEEAANGHRLLLGVNALVRANVSVRLLASGRQERDHDPEIEQVKLAMQVAF